MDAQDSRGRLRLAALLGAAALALPGGVLIGNAVAAGGDTSPSRSEQQFSDPGFAPVQETQPEEGSGDDRRPDGRDCPKDGQGDGRGSGSGGSGGSGSSGTAL